MSQTARVAVLLGCLTELAGCSSLDSASDNYQNFVLGTHPEGGAGGTVDPGPWACVANPTPFVPAADHPTSIEYRVSVKDFNLQSPVPNLTVKVCIIGDADCQSPLPLTITNPVPKDPRIISMMLPFGLIGFLRLNSPGATPPPGSDGGAIGYIQTEYYFGGPVIGSPSDPGLVQGEDILMPRSDELAGFFIAVSAKPNAKAGILALRTIDCFVKRAPGVHLTLLPTLSIIDPGFSYTLRAGQPFRYTPPSPDLTDTQGVAGFANIEPMGEFGGVSAQGTTPTGATYPSDSMTSSYRIRAGQLTLGELRPDYSWGK